MPLHRIGQVWRMHSRKARNAPGRARDGQFATHRECPCRVATRAIVESHGLSFDILTVVSLVSSDPALRVRDEAGFSIALLKWENSWVMLFEPIILSGRTARNRAWVSPMCQHSAFNGQATPWHLVHLGARAVGGAGLVMVESTSIRADGRISPYDAGLWDDSQIESWRGVSDFVKSQGALSAVQLSHAGRKASTHRPWQGQGYLPPADGGWATIGPSAVAFGDFAPPRSLSTDEVAEIPKLFAAAAERAELAGFDVIELHAAHGYLLHQFLSPLSNARNDAYGGDFERRIRLTMDVVAEVRRRLRQATPLFIRISATDWTPGGWDIEQSVELSRRVHALGVDLVDVSTGGNVPNTKIPVGPGYQLPFSAQIRREAGVPTAVVGLITTPEQAEEALANREADAIMIGRAHLDDPYWVRHAARKLGVDMSSVHVAQYDRAELNAGRYSSLASQPQTPSRHR